MRGPGDGGIGSGGLGIGGPGGGEPGDGGPGGDGPGDGGLDRGGGEAGRVWLCVVVQDTGIGISREQQALIFERFSQAEGSTTRKYGGTGLGLAIVKELMALQDGQIEVESEVGKGTTFTFFIPYMLVETAPVAAALSGSAEPRMDGIAVLVADDNRMNQRLMEHLLRGAGISFEIVDDGRKAIDRLKEKPFHLVLMDIQMPVMDGYTASRMIREDLRSSIPIIAMTAHAMRGEREKCLESGMNDYLSKPTVEGDNWMITQQVAAYLIKKMTAAAKSPSTAGTDETDARFKEFVRNKRDAAHNQIGSISLSSDQDIVKSFKLRATALVS